MQQGFFRVSDMVIHDHHAGKKTEHQFRLLSFPVGWSLRQAEAGHFRKAPKKKKANDAKNAWIPTTKSKIQVLHLVSLRSQKAILSLPPLYRVCTELPSIQCCLVSDPLFRVLFLF